MSYLSPELESPGRRAPHGLPRLLAGLDASGAPLMLARHLAEHGPLPRPPAQELIEAVERSGLRGRGGADFPTAQKLRSISARRRRPVLVVNGSETEPGSAKDALLLSRLPHLVLDGAELVAGTIGASEAIVKLRSESAAPQEVLAAAISERSRGAVKMSLVSGPGGYVSGEETAVVNFLGSGRSLPTVVPPRPYARGLNGRPTLIQNPETLAQVALVARYGPRWYRELGSAADPGTALVTISGDVVAPGVYELAFGTPIRDLLAAAGGSTEPLQALLVGGYFGTWVRASQALKLRLAREDLRSVGCSLGSGVLVALGQSACGLHESLRVIDYLAGESVGQCGPCVHGLPAIADSFAALADGVAPGAQQDQLLRWTGEIKGRGACHHPDGTARFVESALRVFGGTRGHARQRCPSRRPVLPIPPKR